MKIAPLAVFSAISLASAQMPTAVIQPHASAVSGRRVSSAAAPVLGYVLGPGATQLRPILATSALARLGDPLTAPSDSKRLYLPPRQQYSLVESSAGSLAVWDFHSEEPVLLSTAMAHPDLVSFSPRGEAVVLYSQGSGSLQVVCHLPTQPVVSQISLAGLGMLAKAAISDDGELVVAELADGGVLASWKGGTWNILPGGATPAAWSFVPRSHNLAVSDGVQNDIILMTHSEGVWSNPRILARNVQADELAASVSGNELVAASRSDGKIWTIALESGEVTARPNIAQAGMLSCLRDGFTFVVSMSPGLSLLNVRPEAAESTAGAFRE